MSGERKKLMGWNVPWPRLMWTGANTFGGVGGGGTGRVSANVTCWGQGEEARSCEVVVAMMSMPVLSRPRKKSSPAGSRLGMSMLPNKLPEGLPWGISAAGTIFRNRGGAVKAPDERLGVTGELLQV